MFNAITGFLKADSGEVSFKDYRLTGKRPQVIVRLGIARTFQNLRLFTDLTVLDNVVSALPSQFGEDPIRATFCSSALAARRMRCAGRPPRS